MVQENGAQNSPYLISRQRDYKAGPPGGKSIRE